MLQKAIAPPVPKPQFKGTFHAEAIGNLDGTRSTNHFIILEWVRGQSSGPLGQALVRIHSQRTRSIFSSLTRSMNPVRPEAPKVVTLQRNLPTQQPL